ncbi:hypothetical protein G3A49_00160 [Haloferax volcanii]|uniref:Uncharacterized protein n=4 Tax=Haloferax TaxID=2251 RepID=M0I2D2_HALVO|nr:MULTISPECIES: DUF5828 family protein [Haloferax]ELK55117.1 hypothetical protein D320_06340 [Haloferax sp. BAB-2207]ELZ57366.1 hypothetical protein C460_12676 [Haloferax sp. ATCC BAA-646]ELZ62330.1 hypothetical protein C459_14060 [Haloferax sp. ATCC BAA-645]ELZ65413.1 hypothetical protein C458_13620 [Haloferax sp. ATCC BAA-644]ELZ70066.1 hypothetical protein C456_18261 [Haloferax lucentense DSM 14919]
MEESISGFKRRGTWDEVVEHGERITRALRDADVDSTAFDDWDEWRPKSHERLGEDVNEKTAQQASVGEGEGEKAGKTPNDDLKTAGEKLSRSYERVEEGDNEGAVESWQDSINYVARAADSAGRKALRKVEDTVYRNVMTQLAPYYFDNELVSANIQRVGRGSGDERFVFEVNVNDDELKSMVSETLRDFEDEIDRWHIDTPKETEVAEAVEGVEVPTTDEEHRSNWTTN